MSRQLNLHIKPSMSLQSRVPHLFTSKIGTNQVVPSGCLGHLNYSSFYKTMSDWQLSEQKMRELSFPRQHPSDSNRAEIVKPYHKFLHYISDPSKRKCKNCRKIYNVNHPRRPCNYHWKGLRYATGVNICCNRPKGGAPCASSPRCMTDEIDINSLFGFKNTSTHGQGGPEIYALDAEMAFTEETLEACAVTLVDANCKVVYETCFLPDRPIIDYNTRHSHLTREDFRNVNITLVDVHQQLLRFIGKSTIVVGHGLTSDLICLKLIHNNIVDTSVLFPPKNQKTWSLKELKEEYLGDIAEDNYKLKCTGDTIATMKLVLLKAFMHEKGYSNFI